jgi:acyl-coenzyme A synthetase/AMP-(fatty) acid ligase
LWVSEPDAQGKVQERAFTYDQLLRRVNQCANALKQLGVGRATASRCIWA